MVLASTEDQGIFRSADRGTSWKSASNGLENQSINAVWFSPTYDSDRTVFAGSAGNGVYRSTDGGDTWVVQTNPALYTLASVHFTAS